jgi:hypothetical protein
MDTAEQRAPVYDALSRNGWNIRTDTGARRITDDLELDEGSGVVYVDYGPTLTYWASADARDSGADPDDRIDASDGWTDEHDRTFSQWR